MLTIIQLVQDWLDKRKARKEERLFRSGFQWAMMAHLYDDDKLEDLAIVCDCPTEWKNSFDSGAEEAIRFLKRRGWPTLDQEQVDVAWEEYTHGK
jgi:hypothetical protein